jgi:hypothetical protein
MPDSGGELSYNPVRTVCSNAGATVLMQNAKNQIFTEKQPGSCSSHPSADSWRAVSGNRQRFCGSGIPNGRILLDQMVS